eukprot:403370107
MEAQQQQNQVDQEAQVTKSKYWDSFASLYDQKIQSVATQPFITLCTQVHLEDSKRILEVACGGGHHSILLASHYLKRGSALVSCDFSKQMMEMTQAKFQDKEVSGSYTYVPGNKFKIVADEVVPFGDHSFDIEEQLRENGVTENERFVFGCQANNESLPFKDQSFDCYISNLSLMLVDNHMNQLREAFRVTQSGSYLAFTVWGRKEHCNNFSILGEVYENNDLGPKEKPAKTNWHLGQDQQKLKSELESVGFDNIHMWYQPMNFPYRTFEEFYESIFQQPTSAATLATLDEAGKNKIKEDARKLFDERMGKNVLDPESFEVMIVVCQRP